MFGFGKKKKKKSKKSDSKLTQSERIRAEALENARAARENLGDETVQKIAKIMEKMESQPMKQAQDQIANADAQRVADEILYMLEQRKKNRLN